MQCSKFQAVLGTGFERHILVKAGPGVRFAGASDAAADDPERPSGGFLLAFLPGSRLAGVVTIGEHIRTWLLPSGRW